MATPLLFLLLLLLPNLYQAAEEDGEKQVLLSVKENLIDSGNVLSNWNSSTGLCEWKGVFCSDDDNPRSVTQLNFTNFYLNGTISPAVCDLPGLTTLILLYNNFRQSFPFWISKCTRLTHLDLGQNFFTGPLPGNISRMGLPLQHLDLSYNEFTGPVPADLGELVGLEFLSLAGNRFISLAPELGKLSNLTYLSLSNNLYLTPAPIPLEFGKLAKVTYLNLAYCQLVGDIPAELGDLKELDFLQLQWNNLTGSIPTRLMFLPKLTKLELYVNQLTGEIPPEIRNLVSLTDLDVSQNLIKGSIPEGISELKELRILQVYHNQLSGELPQGLADLKHLDVLVMYSNSFSGELPQFLGRNTSLSYFSAARNKLTGRLPPFLCNGGRLENLSLYNNMFSGPVPETYGGCRNLMRFQLQNNNLEGVVPQGVWSIPSLKLLNLAFNRLNGSVSSAIKGAAQLNYLILDDNKFEDELPGEMGELSDLIMFTATGNRFSGPVPFGRCNALENLNLSRNQLSSDISDVENCRELIVLDLSENKLSGTIPSTLASLPRINALNLSDNQLTGTIPPSLGAKILSMLDVSHNDLEGSVPGNLKTNFPAASFDGNPQLCIDSCPRSRSSKSKVGLVLPVVIVATIFVFLVGTVGLCWQHHRMLTRYPRWKMKSFQRLSFSEMTVIEKLNERNVVGSGLTGKVYRVDLVNQTVAVKELYRTVWHDTAFQAEAQTLSTLRHRNIVKLFSCCSNREMNLLILEYMPNGSLGDHLHGKKVVNLDWKTRMKIAVGAAQGLAYLHHDCCPPILHRDIKSNNILLDSDYEAKLADFGISKLLETETMTSVAGTYGYIAPEYSYTLKVNEKSDIYSFGVVLLELVTGKRPVESAFGECIDVVRWVRSRIHTKGGAAEVIDCCIRGYNDVEAEQKMVRLLDVALLCTSASPAARPSMRQVVEILKAIQPEDHSSRCSKANSFSSSSSSSSSASPKATY